MKTLLYKLLNRGKQQKSIYGWSIFAMDDSVHLSRRVIDAQYKQNQLTR